MERRAKTLIVKALVVLLAGVGCSPPPQQDPRPEGIVCDLFELRWELAGDELLLAVDTDLPDEGELSVSVGRSYFRIGSETADSRDYLSVFEPVSRWRQPRRVRLDPDKWRADLAAHQKRMEEIDAASIEDGTFGLPPMAFEVARIADHVEIHAFLHAKQDDPRFGGQGNPNLSGSATKVDENGRVLAEAWASFEFPLD